MSSSARTAGRGPVIPWLALGASAFAALLATGVLGAPRAYALVGERVAQGDILRLWTGHFVHFNQAHLLGDLLAFAVWGTLTEWESRRLLAFTLFAGAPLLSLALLALCPELTQYRGLSALDCALVVELSLLRGLALDVDGARLAPTLLVARALGRSRIRVVSLACGVVFVSKCAYELESGSALLAPDLGRGVRLLPVSHVLGATLAALAVTALAAARRARLRRWFQGA